MFSKKEEKDVRIRFSPRGKFDPRFIEQVVLEVSAGLPIQAALAKYELKESTLAGWLQASPHYQPRRSKSPSAAQKRSVVRFIREGKMTVKEAMSAYAIKSSCTIRAWLKSEKLENNELAASNQQTMAKKQLVKKQEAPSAAADEIAALRQALEYEKLRTAALNTLIDVAEEQLKINIRKKPGTKQS